MPRTKSVTCFVVREVSWNYNDEWYYREDGEVAPEDEEEGILPVGDFHRPVKAFRDRQKAEAYARERDHAARASWGNPFMFAEGLAQMTSLSEDEFWSAVEALGVRRPQTRAGRYWFGYDWWEHSKFKPNVAHAIWDLFDRIRFFEIVETRIPLEA